MRSRTEADQAFHANSATYGTLLGKIAQLDTDESWRGDGAADLASWLSARWKVSYARAREWVDAARALRERPALAEAAREGEVSQDQLAAIITLSEPGTDDDELWLEAIQGPDYSSIAALQREARKERARQLEAQDGGVYLTLAASKDERFLRIRGQLRLEDGAVLMKALDRAVPKDASWREVDRFRALGLIELTKGYEGSSSRSGRATVVVHVNQETLAGGDEPGRIDNVGYIPAEAARRLACDGRIHQDGKTSEAVPTAVFYEVKNRDVTCTHPTCERERFVQAHHIKPRRQGGATIPSNLVLVCSYHHRLVHEAGWRLAGEAGPNITWIRPDGTILEPELIDTS